MELDVQDWLIVIGALLILGVLLDAFRRWRNERRNPIKLLAKPSLGMGGGFGNDAEPSRTELPSGGARVVVRDPDAPPEAQPEALPSRAATKPVVAPPPARSQRVEPRLEAATPPFAVEAMGDEASSAVRVPMSSLSGTEEIVVLRLVARSEHGFPGAELQRILAACDVRFGPKQIYHRYEEEKGQGAVQFSIVNGVEPGTFDAQGMDGFRTPALGLFMRLPGPQKPLEAFDCMLETARTLAKYLDGELRDGSNSVFTQQTGEHCRQRIREYALRLRARR